MTTPAPAQLQGEPFSEALSEAAQAAAMSVRLILTIADAVRRASQKHHHGQEQELDQDLGQVAKSWWSADELGKHLPASLLDHLMASEDWPVMARQLTSLSHAGVDLTTFLPNLGSMASGVERAVAKNIARTKAEGTDRWADLLRTTIPEGLVRNAIIASPAWPDIAAHMGCLHDQGVDIARILTDAHAHAHADGLGVDRGTAVKERGPGYLDSPVQVGGEHGREAVAGPAFAQFPGLAAAQVRESAREPAGGDAGFVVRGSGVCLVDDLYCHQGSWMSSTPQRMPFSLRMRARSWRWAARTAGWRALALRHRR